MKKYLLSIAIFLSLSPLCASRLLLGDLTESDAHNNGFSFTLLSKLAKNRNQEHVYMASAVDLSNAADSVKEYSLSVGINNGAIIPAARAQATINGTADQTNPLHGAQFSNIHMAGNFPILTLTGNTATFYAIASTPSSRTQVILTNDTVLDSAGNPGSFISLTDTGNLQDSFQGIGSYIIAAVKPQGGNFGDTEGGITVYKQDKTGFIQQKAVGTDDTVKSVTINKSTTVFKISGQNDLAQLESNKINLYWSDTLSRLYIGIQGTSGADTHGGVKNTAIAYLQDDGTNATLSLYNICPDNAITGETKIVAAKGANKTAWVYKQTVMTTTTGLTYLIGLQESEDAGNNNATQYNCYALPLVNESVDPTKSTTWKTSQTHGTLAKKDSTPVTYYRTTSNGVNIITGRGFQESAQNPNDLFDKGDAPVVVGRAPMNLITNGTILDIEVYNDCVFALVSAGIEHAGVFYSQAIFDENGVIKNWTSWQRTTFGLYGDSKDFMYSKSNGNFLSLEATNNGTKTLFMYGWSQTNKDGLLGGSSTDESIGFTSLLSEEFPESEGGIFNITDFPSLFGDNIFLYTDNGLGQIPRYQGPYTSMSITTGYKKVLLTLTHSNTAQGEVPVIGDFKNRTLHFTNGATNNAVGAGDQIALSISGGALDTVKSITSSTMLYNQTNDRRFIVVGGSGGVAILRNPDTHHGLTERIGAYFNGWDAPMAFEIIGDFTNVQKLWTIEHGNDQFLFILTKTGLYRIDVQNLENVNPAATTLATLADFNSLGLTENDFFTDIVASYNFCLLGTNKGLFRNGNGTDICTTTNATQTAWTNVPLYDGYPYVTQILPLLTSSLLYEFATNDEGQVYVISQSTALTRSAIFRFLINKVGQADPVNDTTIVPVYNTPVETIQMPLFLSASSRTTLATNGAHYLTTASGGKLITTPQRTLITTSEPYPMPSIPFSLLTKNTPILRGLVRNSATGSWIAYGNCGIQVSE